MDRRFVEHVEALRPQLEHLLGMEPCTAASLPRDVPGRGIYLFSECGRHLYVGRSNGIRRRVSGHCRPSATHGTAAFAFRLAREATGNLAASYRSGEGSRGALVRDAGFLAAFENAKRRVREMELRFVGEAAPTRQALLKIYVAVVLDTPYNDFDNH